MKRTLRAGAQPPARLPDPARESSRIASRLESAHRLRTLAGNLAVAGALCRSFELGHQWGFWSSDPYDDGRSSTRGTWSPNTDGKQAP